MLPDRLPGKVKEMAERLVSFDSLKVDLKARRDGEWKDSPNFIGVSYLVRSANYKPFVVAKNAAERRLRAAIPKAQRNVGLDHEDVVRVLGPLVAEHLLLDWKGFADTSGKPLPYTVELGQEKLGNPEFQNLYWDVIAQCGDVGEGELKYVEDEGKNSKKPSATP